MLPLLSSALGCALPGPADPSRPSVAVASGSLGAERELSEEQGAMLRAGGRIERLVHVERGERRYVGGVAYVLVRAAPALVFHALNRIETLAQVLPSTRSAEILERSGNRVRVAFEQGNALVSTRFTLFFELEPPDDRFDPHVVRFWLDPSRAHGIDDVWGFFRVTRYDAEHSLVSVGALVDLGPGLIRTLFEDRIQRSILRMPKRIRDTIEPRLAASPVEASPVEAPVTAR